MYSLASIHSFETAFPPGRVADPFSHAGPFTPGNCHQDSPRSSLQHVADLPVLGIYFMHEVLPTLSCGVLTTADENFRVSAYRECKECSALF